MSKRSRKSSESGKTYNTKPQAAKFQQPRTETELRSKNEDAKPEKDQGREHMEAAFQGKLAARETGRRAIAEAIAECAQKLGHAPSLTEIEKLTVYNRRQVRRHFGSYRAALSECKLERGGGGWKVPMEALFRDWAMVARALKKLPTASQYAQVGQYSDGPLTTRFGGWLQVPQGMKRYIEERGWTEEWRDVLEMIAAEKPAPCTRRIPPPEKAREISWGGFEPAIKYGKVLPDRPIYGALARPYPFIHAPTNEDGVLVLFGALAERLGFMVERVQKECPDCEAMRLVGPGKCQRVRIEFEYESRNFHRHTHDANRCDIIVCWLHNWPECPLEVIELSEVVRRLG